MEDELRNAISAGDLPRVRLLVQGGASIADSISSSRYCRISAVNWAADHGKTSIVEWLLAEGGASISDVDHEGVTILLLAVSSPFVNFTMVQWLLEHGGADITNTTPAGRTTWDLLGEYITRCPSSRRGSRMKYPKMDQLTALLRVMVLRSAPPDDLVVQMFPEHSHVAEEGARLRAGLPAYLARRQALLAEHTSLIAPLRALVSSYEEPTTTEELWATGLGALR
jgi:hypothetical protein